MFTHSDIWRAIDRLASTSGYSASGLAKKAGLDPTTFNKSKRTAADGKPRWPSTESIAKILSVTGLTMSDFMGLIEDTAGKPSRPTRMIPILGMAQAGSAGYFDDAGYPAGTGWDEVAFPEYDSTVDDSHIYALEITGDSMQPLYRNGDLIVLAPGAPIRRGDRVVVRTRGGEVMAKELVKQTSSKIELKSLNPDHDDRTFKMNEVAWVARILWVSQ
jgi:phage repressor protein C with HTH and peptisase S24 domain